VPVRIVSAAPQSDSAGNPVRKIGSGVSTPQVIHQVEPDFTTEARKAKFMGTVIVGCIVNERGVPEDVHVVRGVGLGLNDKAIQAVKQYKFKPAMEGGKPVPVQLNIEVNFQIV
jgi:protein TonB